MSKMYSLTLFQAEHNFMPFKTVVIPSCGKLKGSFLVLRLYRAMFLSAAKPRAGLPSDYLSISVPWFLVWLSFYMI